MIKCFLSHSSADKESYVRIVASGIRKENTILDEDTFEAGMPAIEEIIKGLDETSLFVLFLSNEALNSKWVQDELHRAKDLLDNSQIERIYPIIIEEAVKYNDPRIPEWMRESINIQPIVKPSIATRKINSRLTEIAWKFHPRLKERQEIFVGRNSLVTKIEERFDDLSQQMPVVLCASGLPSIGRKSFIRYSLRKSNVIRASYEFPVVSLSQYDAIEDFIAKIYDLGFIDVERYTERLHGDVSEKVALAREISEKLVDERERIIIEDRGVIVESSGEIVDWFIDVIDAIKVCDHLTFSIASRFRANPSLNRKYPWFFSVSLGDLEKVERDGLLGRYAKFHNLTLSRDEYSFLSDILTGYPEQVLFSVDLVNEHGMFYAKKHSHMIQEYGSDKARVVLDTFQGDENSLNLIYLLSKFEFISYDVLFDIVDEEKFFPVLEHLVASSVCERMGATSEYIRVNEAVRDFVNRSRFGIPTEFDDSIKRHISSFLQRYDDDVTDISDYIFSVQESLRMGDDIPDDMIIPSVFLKTIKKIYDDERNYEDAILLADRVLQKEAYLHSRTVEHIRYIKCQSLARLRNPEFFAEVRFIPEPDRSFLHGFYYRLSGNYAKAEESLKRVLSHGKRRDARAVGELVLVYTQSDEFERAFELAKENYLRNSSNPISANNYFACLLMRDKSQENRKELEKIIEQLEKNHSDRAQEMVESAKARLIAIYDNDEARSLSLIDESIHRFPNVNYPVLTKADLAAHFKNKEKLREAVDMLEGRVRKNAQNYRSFVRYKAYLLALEGELHQAKQLVNRELNGLIGSSLDRLNEHLESFAKGKS